jgi:esterase/lipase superfamily enzyme
MESPGKHVMLRSISELPHDMFFASLRGHVARLDKRTAFVFVHGFNCDFAAAARRAAQIAFDLFFQEENDQVAELSVAPILFSWPSEGSAVKYTHDVSNAKSSIKLLQNFLREVVEQSGAEAITLIAHSMGCDLLTAALEKIALAMQAEDGPIIQELILAAPDIDRDYFQQIADQVIRTTRRTTLYASEEDRALFLSRQANGHPRAGDSRNGVVIIEGIDSIDATKVGEDILRHSYVGGATVLGDIFYIIRNGHPPDQRYGLFGQGNPPKRWWAFR